MEWLERMNRAIDYIEDNLPEEIELGTVARMACCSSYQFQRMFSFITDVTLAEMDYYTNNSGGYNDKFGPKYDSSV